MGCCELESGDEHFGKHRPILLGTIIVAVISYVCLIAVNLLGEFTVILTTGIDHIVNDSAIDLAFKSSIRIIWILIYIWHSIILIYCVLTIFRKTVNLQPVYTSPTLLSYFFFIYLTVCYIFQIGWLFLWGMSSISPSLILIFVITASLYLALIVSYRKLHHYNRKLRETNQRKERWLIILIVENGVALLAAWNTVMFYLNLCVSLVSWGTVPSVASLVCLCVFAIHFVIFAITDLTILDKYTRYVFTPYCAIAVALFGMMVRNWKPGNINFIFIVVFATFVVICAIVKLIRTCIYIVRKNRTIRPPFEVVTISTVTNGTEPPTTNDTSFSSDIDMEDIHPAFNYSPPVVHRSLGPLEAVSEEPEIHRQLGELPLVEFVPYN